MGGLDSIFDHFCDVAWVRGQKTRVGGWEERRFALGVGLSSELCSGYLLDIYEVHFEIALAYDDPSINSPGWIDVLAELSWEDSFDVVILSAWAQLSNAIAPEFLIATHQTWGD